MVKYKFYEFYNREKDCRAIKAVTSYEGKTIIGVANLHPGDEYDYEIGKEIARLKCERKVLKRKKIRFFRKAKDTALNSEFLRNQADNLMRRSNSYVETALETDNAITKNAKKLDELLNQIRD